METSSTYLSPADRNPGPTLLVVDDNQDQHDLIDLLCGEHFNSDTLRILHVKTIPAALNLLCETPVHAILLDKDVGPDRADPSQNGIEAIPRILRIQPHAQILVVTGNNRDLQEVVHAIMLGALGYVTKETQRQLLPAQIPQAIRIAKQSLDKALAENGIQSLSPDDVILGGKSKTFTRLLNRLSGVAESNRATLLLGPTGVGKTAIAARIHQLREAYLGQTRRPFLAINLKALTENTLESRLFGHEKGAFTGADSVQQGLFELANSGTLFLDEIGEISLDMQAKLLKVVEEGRFYRMGGKREIHTSLKLICATNRNLEEMVEKGIFREDLYMRISTFVLKVPSLEERREDIPEIIKALIPRISMHLPVKVRFEDLPRDLIEELTNNLPRGNIRGIERILEQVITFAPKDRRGRPILKDWQEIDYVDYGQSKPSRSVGAVLRLKEFLELPLDVVGDGFPGLIPFLDLVADKVVQDAYEKNGKTGKVAQALGVSPGAASIRLNRLRSYGIRDPRTATRPRKPALESENDEARP